jgi:hypothetical protein
MAENDPKRRGDTLLVTLAAVFASLAAFLYYYRHGQILLYGDSVAHITIARRVFDSLTPSVYGLGTVWLPLPHVLMMPFTVPLDWWQSGAGGSIYSMVAYVFGCVGIFRLTLRLTASRAAAWLAFAVFAMNPNMLYMQSTSMTESLCIALFIWIAIYFADFVEQSRNEDDAALAKAARSLTRCGLCIAAMVLTRYDGWFSGLVFVLAAFAVLIRRRGWIFLTQRHAPLWRGVRNMALISAAAPLSWFAWNWLLSGHPLDFALGPYSAKAIAARTAMPNATYPGEHSLAVAAIFYRKCAEMILTMGGWQHVLFFAALLGTLFFLFSRRWVVLLLWLPWAFYTLSLAYGDVPIFMPQWWPYSYYNVRFGLQLLPAIAVGVGMTPAMLTALSGVFLPNFQARFRPKGAASESRWFPGSSIFYGAACAAVLLITGVTYYTGFRMTPITLREATANSKARIALEKVIAADLSQLPPESRLLMYIGDHSGALQRAGIPLRRTINESTHLHSEQPGGLWERALADPAHHADYVIAFEGDPVAKAAREHPEGLQALLVIHSEGQPPATIYQSLTPPR